MLTALNVVLTQSDNHNHGRRLGAGVYFYTLKTESDKLTHKVVLTSAR